MRDRRRRATGGPGGRDGWGRHRDRRRHDRHSARVGPVRAAAGAGGGPRPRARQRLVLSLRARARSGDGGVGEPAGGGADPRSRRRHARTGRSDGGPAGLHARRGALRARPRPTRARGRRAGGAAAGDPHRPRVRRGAGRGAVGMAGSHVAARRVARDRPRRGDRPYRGLRPRAGGRRNRGPAGGVVGSRADDPARGRGARRRRVLRGDDAERGAFDLRAACGPVDGGAAAGGGAGAGPRRRPTAAHAPAEPARGPGRQRRRRDGRRQPVRDRPLLPAAAGRTGRAGDAAGGAASRVVRDRGRVPAGQGDRHGGPRPARGRCRRERRAARIPTAGERPAGGRPRCRDPPASRRRRALPGRYRRRGGGRPARHVRPRGAGGGRGVASRPSRVHGPA